jgi:CRISPR-associated protein Cmr4
MTAETQTRCLVQRYLLMTLDPVHPGAGGYRLGRVDLSIVREPGTRLPKIPGTSLHGAARSYAAMRYEKPEAAGQSQENVKEPEKNPVCYTFGYIRKDKQGSEQAAFSGVVNVFDAHILLFPVHSMLGPIWVSTLERLQESGFKVVNAPPSWDKDKILTALPDCTRLNLGWLMLDVAGPVQIQPPDEWKDRAWDAVAERIVLVDNTLFSHIVNSNLEVRTSVSIDPHTGAAADGALFTYEALPRAAFLTAEVVLDEYVAEHRSRPFPVEKTNTGKPLPKGPWQGPLDVVKAGLGMMEFLGVGGMGTRGFGRMKIVGAPLEKDPLKDAKQEAAQ